jgi:hypothetical protein
VWTGARRVPSRFNGPGTESAVLQMGAADGIRFPMPFSSPNDRRIAF